MGEREVFAYVLDGKMARIRYHSGPQAGSLDREESDVGEADHSQNCFQVRHKKVRLARMFPRKAAARRYGDKNRAILKPALFPFGRHVKSTACTNDVIDPGLQDRRDPQVMHRCGDHDRIRALDFLDQFFRKESAGIAHHPLLRQVDMRNRIDTEQAFGKYHRRSALLNQATDNHVGKLMAFRLPASRAAADTQDVHVSILSKCAGKGTAVAAGYGESIIWLIQPKGP